jgi:hypothetical protein
MRQSSVRPLVLLPADLRVWALMSEESPTADSMTDPIRVGSSWMARLITAFALFAILAGPSQAFGNWAQGFSTSRPSKLVERLDTAVHGARQATSRLLQLDWDRHVPSPTPLCPFALAHSLSIRFAGQERERVSFAEPVSHASARDSIVAQPRAPPHSSLAA